MSMDLIFIQNGFDQEVKWVFVSGGKDIGNGMKHPKYDIDNLEANGKCSGGKNAIPKGRGGGPRGKRQEPQRCVLRTQEAIP